MYEYGLCVGVRSCDPGPLSFLQTPFLIQSIDSMMAEGAHYLLNVGPDTDGRIPDVGVTVLTEIGARYGSVREAFSGTQPCTSLTTNPDVLPEYWEDNTHTLRINGLGEKLPARGETLSKLQFEHAPAPIWCRQVAAK